MATLNRSFSLSGSCTRADLYNLLNTASVQAMTPADLEGDFPSITACSEPPTFSDQLWWYDQTNQLLKVPVATVGASPASLYLSIGPDAWHFPGYNVADHMLRKGTFVRFSYSAAAGLYDMLPMEPLSTAFTGNVAVRASYPFRNAYGFLQQDTEPGQWGPVLTYGFGHATVDWPTVATYVGDLFNDMAFVLSPSTAYTGAMQACTENTNSYPPRLYKAQCAMGLAQPETTNVSVLCPIFCNLPVGHNQT